MGALLGPAFVAAVAYVDPGNIATNVTAGSRYGFTLVWVVVVASLAAILVQYLSAKLGIVTERSLSTHLADRLSRRSRIAFWVQAELMAFATDLAEIVGGAVALAILFDLPLFVGALCTTVVSLVILGIGDRYGQRALERVIMGFLLLIAVGFLASLVVAPPDGAALARGLVPSFDGADSVLLASGIIGATVMPHVIYLHSSLTIDQRRRSSGISTGRLVRITRNDVILALTVAGALNLALLATGAGPLGDAPNTDTLEGAHQAITDGIGPGVALLFAIALLASGLASTSVGSAAGSEIMASLVNRRIPPLVRRLLTTLPAVALLAVGADPTRTLIWSQVILSMGIPFALLPLVVYTSRPDVMGGQANLRITSLAAWIIGGAIIALNLALLGLLFTQ